MTLAPVIAGTYHTHPLIDYAAHGVRSFRGDTSIYIPELPFLLLSTLCYHRSGTVVPYATLAAVMWPGTVSEPYDGSYNRAIRDHLACLRAIMARDGQWPVFPFKVKYDVGICVIQSLIADVWR